MLAIDETSFAELNRAIIQSATESQIVKKAGLLKKTKLMSAIRKKVTSEVKMAQHKSLLADIEKWGKSDFAISDLSQLVGDINSNDRFKQYRGTIGVRRVLSLDDPPIQSIIDAKLVPRMIEFMQMEDEPKLQLEAAWVLTNVASGTTDQTQNVIKKGAIPWFVKLLQSNNPELREQAIWAVGNISGDSSTNRNITLKHGALQPLLKIADESLSNLKILKLATWAISNLCRGRPYPELDYVRAAVPTLFNILQSQNDSEVLKDAAWALSAFSNAADDLAMDLIMACSNALPALISLLSRSESTIVIACLRTLGNICYGDEFKIDAVINCPEFFWKIYNLLEHTETAVRKESLFVLSNITAGTPAQNALLWKSFPFVTKLIWFFENDAEEIKIEALWVFSNALKHAEEEQRVNLYQSGILNCFILMLESNETEVLKITLSGIYQLLCLGEAAGNKNENKENLVLMELQDRGVLDRLDALQDYDNDEVKKRIMRILKDFVPFIEIRPEDSDDEEEEENSSYEDDESENEDD